MENQQTPVEWLESMLNGMIQNGACFGEDTPALLKHIEKAKQKEEEYRASIRTAVAHYMLSEGCSCCEGGNHKEHAEELAKLLDVPKYEDGSGYNFYKFRTNY